MPFHINQLGLGKRHWNLVDLFSGSWFSASVPYNSSDVRDILKICLLYDPHMILLPILLYLRSIYSKINYVPNTRATLVQANNDMTYKITREKHVTYFIIFRFQNEKKLAYLTWIELHEWKNISLFITRKLASDDTHELHSAGSCIPKSTHIGKMSDRGCRFHRSHTDHLRNCLVSTSKK